jgi:hypothetical protein
VLDSLDSFSEWADVVQLVGLPVAAVALFLGWIQLRKASRTGRVQILLALDERLSDFEDLRAELNKLQPVITDTIRLRRYIAAFERMGHALRLREIDLETVDEFYGSRFKNLVVHSETGRIVKKVEGGKDFHDLWKELYNYNGNQRAIPQPQAGI